MHPLISAAVWSYYHTGELQTFIVSAQFDSSLFLFPVYDSVCHPTCGLREHAIRYLWFFVIQSDDRRWNLL